MYLGQLDEPAARSRSISGNWIRVTHWRHAVSTNCWRLVRMSRNRSCVSR